MTFILQLDFDSEDHSKAEPEKDADFFEEMHSKTQNIQPTSVIHNSARLSEHLVSLIICICFCCILFTSNTNNELQCE